MLENERLRIARELHDDLGSTLTAIRWAISTSENGGEGSGVLPDPQLMQAVELVDSAIETMRRIVSDLRPSVLDQLGVWAAIQWYADQIRERTGLHCHFAVSPQISEYEPDQDRGTAIFRIVQEALTNVVRHAQANHVDIQISGAPNKLVVRVQDDGVGIRKDALTSRQSWGLIGMQERAARFGGEVEISAKRGKGTTLTLRVPIDRR